MRDREEYELPRYSCKLQGVPRSICVLFGLSPVRQGIVAFWCGIINLIPASLLNLQEKAAAALFFFSRVQYSAAAAVAATGRHHHQPFFIAAAVVFYFISIPLARPILLICICRAPTLSHSLGALLLPVYY
jgi:hypothetical protein